MNMCKCLEIPLSKMTFTSDFTVTDRGDLYPLVASKGDLTEHVSPAGYTTVGDGSVERLLASFFPFATYKMKITSLNGAAGFVFQSKTARAEVMIENDDWETVVSFFDGERANKTHLPSEIGEGFELIVSLRPHWFDIYASVKGAIYHVVSEVSDAFRDSHAIAFYETAKVFVKMVGNATIVGASSCIDCGIGQADIRPFKYENGDLVMENGRVFLSISSRLAKGSYQSVLSWLPGTADFKMEGAIFYTHGEGSTKIHSEVAASYVFNRMDNKWHVWVRDGSAGHVLSYGCFDYDIRYGLNIVDVTPLPLMSEAELDDTVLLGKKGDEDPDFTYDAERKKWLFTLCRIDTAHHKYRYYFFESDSPDKDYKFVGLGPVGEETGGSILRLDGKFFFACGNDFHAVSDYRVYEWGKFDTFTNLKCDFPDGGFRGWATIMPIRYGSRMRYFWLTFDRTLMSKVNNWSYGNLYCFEAEGYFKA